MQQAQIVVVFTPWSHGGNKQNLTPQFDYLCESAKGVWKCQGEESAFKLPFELQSDLLSPPRSWRMSRGVSPKHQGGWEATAVTTYQTPAVLPYFLVSMFQWSHGDRVSPSCSCSGIPWSGLVAWSYSGQKLMWLGAMLSRSLRGSSLLSAPVIVPAPVKGQQRGVLNSREGHWQRDLHQDPRDKIRARIFSCFWIQEKTNESVKLQEELGFLKEMGTWGRKINKPTSWNIYCRYKGSISIGWPLPAKSENWQNCPDMLS